MKNKKKSILGILLIIVLLIFFIVLNCYGILKNKKRNNNIIDSEIQTTYNDMIANSIMYNNRANIDDLKEEYNLIGQDDLYQIDTDYDGRKVLNIKPSIDYRVAFSGMVKGEKPEFQEIDYIFNNNTPKGTGIWINEKSREIILNYLNNNEKLDSKYKIDESGYLQIENKNNNQFDKKIEKMINEDMLYVIDISSICYMVDPVTGEIIKNEYNNLDEYQTYEYFSDENRMLIFITENKEKKLTNDEILESILNLV